MENCFNEDLSGLRKRNPLRPPGDGWDTAQVRPDKGDREAHAGANRRLAMRICHAQVEARTANAEWVDLK